MAQSITTYRCVYCAGSAVCVREKWYCVDCGERLFYPEKLAKAGTKGGKRTATKVKPKKTTPKRAKAKPAKKKPAGKTAAKKPARRGRRTTARGRRR